MFFVFCFVFLTGCTTADVSSKLLKTKVFYCCCCFFFIYYYYSPKIKGIRSFGGNLVTSVPLRRQQNNNRVDKAAKLDSRISGKQMRGISFTTQQRTLNLAREIATDPLHPLWSEYVLFTSGPRNAPDAAWKRHRTVCPAERSAAQQAPLTSLKVTMQCPFLTCFLVLIVHAPVVLLIYISYTLRREINSLWGNKDFSSIQETQSANTSSF